MVFYRHVAVILTRGAFTRTAWNRIDFISDTPEAFQLPLAIAVVIAVFDRIHQVVDCYSQN